MKSSGSVPQLTAPSGFRPTHTAAIQAMIDHAISTNPDAVAYWEGFFKNRKKNKADDNQ